MELVIAVLGIIGPLAPLARWLLRRFGGNNSWKANITYWEERPARSMGH